MQFWRNLKKKLRMNFESNSYKTIIANTWNIVLRNPWEIFQRIPREIFEGMSVVIFGVISEGPRGRVSLKNAGRNL